MKFHRSFARFLGLAPALLLLPAGLCSRVAADDWVYFGTYTGARSKGVYVSRMDGSGKLTGPELAATSASPSFLAVDNQHRFLYAANEVDEFAGKKGGAVSAFTLDAATGKLKFLNQQSTIGPGPCHVSVDGTGKVVLAANYGGGSIASFPVHPDGSLGEAGSFVQHHGSGVNASRQEGPHAHCIVTDPDNHLALVCDLGLDKVLLYKLNPANATLSLSTPASASVKAGLGPRHLAFSPNGKFVYVMTEMGCAVTAFAFDAAKSSLTEIQTISTLAPGQKIDSAFSGAEIAVHPSGKFLYASTRGTDTITGFKIDEKTGILTVIENTPSGGKVPRNFGIAPSGRFLLAANQNSDSIIEFNIDPASGKLTPSGQTLSLGKPVCVVFVPVRP